MLKHECKSIRIWTTAREAIEDHNTRHDKAVWQSLPNINYAVGDKHDLFNHTAYALYMNDPESWNELSDNQLQECADEEDEEETRIRHAEEQREEGYLEDAQWHLENPSAYSIAA